MLTINDELTTHENGNYTITIYKNGTKVRSSKNGTSIKDLTPKFPESIDLKITNYCDLGCKYCHEGSNQNGKYANLKKTLQVLKQLPAGTELAIGGGNPMSHPDLVSFLHACKMLEFIPSITMNMRHLHPTLRFRDQLNYLINDKLIYGVGISIDSTPFPIGLDDISNVVAHMIVGINDINLIMDVSKYYKKILLLGYKNIGRGRDYIDVHNPNIYDDIETISKKFWKVLSRSDSSKLPTISFDNLAIEQLDVKKYFLIENKDWEKFYMGNDGQFTMYYDAVEGQFSISSTSTLNWDDDKYSIELAFNHIRQRTAPIQATKKKKTKK